MKAFLKAILTTTAFALALSVSLASLSTVAQAYAYGGQHAGERERFNYPTLLSNSWLEPHSSWRLQHRS
jgi:hypothetical protein